MNLTARLARVFGTAVGLALVALATVAIFPIRFLEPSVAEDVAFYGLAGVLPTALLLASARCGRAMRVHGVAVVASVIVSVILTNWFMLALTVTGLGAALFLPWTQAYLIERIVALGLGTGGAAFYAFNVWALMKGWRLLQKQAAQL